MSRRTIVLGVIVLIIIAGVVGVMVLGGPAATLAIFTGIGDNSVASEPITSEELTPESAAATLFRIVPEESEVRFLLDEVLMGTPTRVIARSSELAGDVVVDFQTPANSQIGTIRVNARTLETDNEFRNRAAKLRGLHIVRVTAE